MKTTENISLAGYAFTIEEDAYDELTAYLEDIRNCFSNDSSADEIAADIEERIAELLKERCISGMVVDMKMIRDVKKRIGNPRELAQEDTGQTIGAEESIAKENRQEKKGWKNRRMFRNVDERIIGGVCAGLGTYFDLDKVIFRIIFLVLFFIGFLGIDDGPFFGLSIIAYVCLWIAMPAARTAEQKREMKGKPMNLQNYRDKDFDFEKEVKDVAQSPAGQTIKRAGGVFLGLILLVIGLGGLIGSIIIPAVPKIISHELMEDIQSGIMDMPEQMMVQLITGDTFWQLILVMCGLLFVWFLYGGIMLLFDLKAPSWRPGLIIFIAWIVSIFVIAGWVVKQLADVLPSII